MENVDLGIIVVVDLKLQILMPLVVGEIFVRWVIIVLKLPQLQSHVRLEPMLMLKDYLFAKLVKRFDFLFLCFGQHTLSKPY